MKLYAGTAWASEDSVLLIHLTKVPFKTSAAGKMETEETYNHLKMAMDVLLVWVMSY